MPTETDQPSLEALPIDVDTSSVEWGEQRWYRVLGYYFSLTTSNPALDDYVRTVIGAFQVDADPAERHSPPTPGIPVQYELLDGDAAGDGRVRLYYNSVVLASSPNAADVLDQMLWHINAESARRTGEFVLVHAGAVAVPGGAGLIIPGVSGTGKSTLVSGLLHAGFGYFSDEAAAIDPIERLLHSYPKAVTLKDRTVFETYPELPSADVRPEYVRNHWYIVPEEIRPDIMAPPAPVGHVVLSRFEPGAATTIEPASRAEAAAAVGRSIINIGRYKARVLPLLADLVAGAKCYRLRSGDLRSAVDAVVAATTD